MHLANIHVQGTVSQIFDLGFSFLFYVKKLFLFLIEYFFLNFIKKMNQDLYQQSETQFP